jgi:hypothetical protein
MTGLPRGLLREHPSTAFALFAAWREIPRVAWAAERRQVSDPSAIAGHPTTLRRCQRPPFPPPAGVPEPGLGVPTPEPGLGVPTPEPGLGAPTPDPVSGVPIPDPGPVVPTPVPGRGVPTPVPGRGVPIPEPLAAGTHGSTREPLLIVVGLDAVVPVVPATAALPALPDVPTVGVPVTTGADAPPVVAALVGGRLVAVPAVVPDVGPAAVEPVDCPLVPVAAPAVAAAGVVADWVAVPVAGAVRAAVPAGVDPFPDAVGVPAGVPGSPATPGACGSHGVSGVARWAV